MAIVYPVQSTLNLSGMTVGQTLVISTDSNSISVTDDTSSNINSPKIHCNDSSPTMSGTRINSGNPDYR
ncbi:MAG: hypothetical protein R2932_16725 [Caldilineaceae bacterium]